MYQKLQDRIGHHVIQIPQLDHPLLCPVLAFKNLLDFCPLPPSSLVFASSKHPYHLVIDTHFRKLLQSILLSFNLDPATHGFHAFRRSGGFWDFECQVLLQNTMAHCLWKSPSVWIYLQDTSTAASNIPCNIFSIIPFLMIGFGPI